MRGAVCLPAVMAVLFFLVIIPAGAQTVTINASPAVVNLGDTIILSGNVSGVHTIAVYLFLAGPDLDSRGVTLENVNVPAGRGLFTTAPVNMKDGTWEYAWDTSVILGNLNPGTYTVFVVSSPVNHERVGSGPYATTKITIEPSQAEATPIPLSPWSAILALTITAGAGAVFLSRQNKRG
ncbi:MAG: hypothetical protein WC367_08995 [Methanoregula sp.]